MCSSDLRFRTHPEDRRLRSGADPDVPPPDQLGVIRRPCRNPRRRGYFNYYLGYSIPYTTTQHIVAPDWAWILMGVFALGQIIILLWRQFALMNGKKMACGICTLIFCSIVGGILTLCIPEDELY